MGDNVLEGQAKNTRKRRAKAAAGMHAPKLTQRPDEVVDRFTIDCKEGQEIAVGEILRCFPGANGRLVDVTRRHENIGSVDETGGGSDLRHQIEQPGAGSLRVSSVDTLAGTAQAELLQD